MGIKRWRKVFSEVNCLENLSDQPEDWKSDEACTLCKATTDAPQSIENTPQTVLTDPTSSASPAGQASEIDPIALSNFTSSLPANQPPFGDYQANSSFASLLQFASMTSTPMMTNSSTLISDSEPLNSLNSLNSLNHLISTTESMAANQNGNNVDLPNIKVVSSFGFF